MVTVECAANPAEAGIDAKSRVEAVPVQANEYNGEDERGASLGTKLSPICVDESMKKQSTPLDELKKQCFSKEFSLLTSKPEIPVEKVSVPSPPKPADVDPKTLSTAGTTESDLTDLMEKSAAINTTVLDRRTSRAGRSTQRWLVDSQNASKVSRLVTGCVPILSGGKILLVSASKKNEWILPKGGWELDEDMEESAIRETFEEAGVIGVLGPKLSEVQYETRKAKERRLAGENGSKERNDTNHSFSSAWSDVSQDRMPDHVVTEISVSEHAAQYNGHKSEGGKAAPADQDGKNAITPQKDAGGIGVEKTPKAYNEVCLCLFPLYVQDVRSDWPESGRLRKSVDIDEAIELLSSRPEMQAMIMEVKDKGLHLI